MNLYKKRRRGKFLLLFIAVVIGFLSLFYTNWLTKKMAEEEHKKVNLWAEAIKRLNDAVLKPTSPEMEQLNTEYLNLITAITSQNTTIPIIIMEDEKLNLSFNVRYSSNNKDKVLKRELNKMKSYTNPIKINLSKDKYQLLYYRESNILRNLRYYPVVQLFVIIIFIIVAYYAVNATQRAEQNQVWVGMSKETAHQLGTPISSLMAWTELLKMQDVDKNIISELEKDTQRLERITERFSKIGSKPELYPTNIIKVLANSADYLRSRSSTQIKFENNYDTNQEINIPLNAALFSWVIENISKNAIDAMDNKGKIVITLKEKTDNIVIDIEDTGKGIPKSQHKTVFHPGFSTKKRGWGLGLSLSKRIIENYHGGKIFVKWSEINKGTIFRIVLNK